MPSLEDRGPSQVIRPLPTRERELRLNGKSVAALDGVVLAQAWAAPVPKGQHIVVVAKDVT